MQNLTEYQVNCSNAVAVVLVKGRAFLVVLSNDWGIQLAATVHE
jgi:hypothetical protein